MTLNSKLSLSKPREKPSKDTEEIKIYIDYIGEDGYVYKYSPSLKKYIKSDICLIGPRGSAGPKGADGKVDYNRLKDEINLDDYATIQYVDEEIAALIGGAPEILDTLKEIADYITITPIPERLNNLEQCCNEVHQILEEIDEELLRLDSVKADKTELNKYVLKAGDTMTGPLNFTSNSAIYLNDKLAVAWADDKISFGNSNNSTQIRSNDHINIKTGNNNWTVWDSGNFNPEELRQIIIDNELTTSAAFNDLRRIIEENELVVSSALNDLQERKLEKADAGELNVIEDIKVNGISLIPENRSVNINIPTSLSELNNDLIYNEVTYDELVELKNNNQLLPGQKYRITDYVTTTMQNDTSSTEYPFDIIVTALNESTLSKKASAIQNSNDRYFSNSDLAAWELEYTTDNIYWSAVKGNYFEATSLGLWFKYMSTITINETTYWLWYNKDFIPGNNMSNGYVITSDDPSIDDDYYLVNITNNTMSEAVGTIGDIKYVPENGKGTITKMKDEFNNVCYYDFKNIQFKRWHATIDYGASDIVPYCISDLNSYPVHTSPDDENDVIWVYTFYDIIEGGTDYSVMGLCSNNYISDNSKHILNNNVIHGNNNFIKYNSFGNTLSNSSNNEISGNYNFLAWGSSGNVVTGNNNFFALNCLNNILNQSSSYNTLQSGCENNTLMQSCTYNNLFPNDTNNRLMANCSHIIINSDFAKYIIVEEGNKNITLQCTADRLNYLRNITIAQGVNNGDTMKTIIHPSQNDEYQTIYKAGNSQYITV